VPAGCGATGAGVVVAAVCASAGIANNDAISATTLVDRTLRARTRLSAECIVETGSVSSPLLLTAHADTEATKPLTRIFASPLFGALAGRPSRPAAIMSDR